MEKLLKGKEVRCHVLTRDLFGRLVAKVQVL
jgi:endonuclease YncB( thermonuclease family)